MAAQRNTVQRQIILDTLKMLRTHPTVDEVYSEVHKTHPTISKTTVYRNLRQLAESGGARRLSLSDSLERYDGTAKQHYHFKCDGCGSISDVEIEILSGLNCVVQQKYGLQVDAHDIMFWGLCLKCASARD
ncbi:MAG: transcriptional repressor [Oscillospiraceae bacterium]|nr:transcriptional repressor [Oscillospiraceae bacterium]